MSSAPSAISFVGPMLGAAALLLAFLVAVRSRTLMKPRLIFTFRMFDEAYPRLPRRLRRKPTQALFLFPSGYPMESDLQVPLGIQNPSNRKISDISLELTYPISFFLPNHEIQERAQKISTEFGGLKRLDEEVFQRISSMRHAVRMGRDVRVRYDIGSLRPGESFFFSEPFKLPERERAFDAGRHEETSFRHVLNHLAESEHVRAAFFLYAALLSDLSPTIRRSIDVVLCAPQLTDNNMHAEEDYVAAYWYGRILAGARYARWPSFRRRRPPVIQERPVDVINFVREVEVGEPKDGVVIVTTGLDALKSRYGIASLYLPGYDPKMLSTEICTPDAALAEIGFIRQFTSAGR